MGVSAISYREMQAYFELHYIEPDIDEIEMIVLFDNAALEHHQAQQKAEEDKKPKK